MSHLNHATYFVNASSTSSNSVEATNSSLDGTTVSIVGNGYLAVYGVIDSHTINVLENNFEIFDDLHNPEVLQLIAE